MDIERRSYKRTPAPEFRAVDDGPGVLAGYAAVFGQYSQNLGGFVEIIEPTAFDDAMERGVDALGLMNHDMNLLLATTGSGSLRLSRDDVGLRYEMDLDMSDPDAVSAAAKIRSGKMPGSSFSFTMPTESRGDVWSQTEQGYPLRTIRSIGDLIDVGPVTMPAYRGTQSSDAATSLRSLSELSGHDLSELVAAAGRNELRSLLPGATEEIPAASNAALHAFRQRELLLSSKRA